MHFELTNEQKEFKGSIKKLLTKYDGTNIAKSYKLGEKKLLNSSWQGLIELGVPAILVPENYDGAELTELELMVVFEELGKVVYPRMFEQTLAFAAPLLKKYGNDRQKELLKKIVLGELIFALAWIEDGNFGYNEEDIQAELVKQGDGYVLNTVKTAVLDDGQADYYIVPVRRNNKIELALVPQQENIIFEQLKTTDDTTVQSKMKFENIQIHELDLIDLHGRDGWSVLQECLLSLECMVCAHLVGAMEKVVEMAKEYALTREQFGNPIGRFQGIKHKLVDMKVDLELARTLTYYASWALSVDNSDKFEAVYKAKAFISEKAVEVAAQNIHIHGAIGITNEIDCHMFLKRAKSLENYLGSVSTYYEKISTELGWSIHDSRKEFKLV